MGTMQPVTNNNLPPKPSDLNLLSQDQGGAVGATGPNFPNGLSEAAVLDYARNKNAAWDKWFQEKFRRIEENRKLWRNLPLEMTRRVGAAPIPMAVGFGILESVAARMNSTLLNRPKMVEAICEQVQADNTMQRKVEDFTNQCLVREAKRPDKGKMSIKGALLDGTAVLRSVWERKPYEVEEALYEVNPLTGEQIQTGIQTRQLFRESWSFRKLSIGNSCWDIHNTTNAQASKHFRERAYMSYNELLQMQLDGQLKGVEQIRKIVPGGLEGTDKSDFEARLKKADGDTTWRTSYGDEKVYKVDEWYALMSYDAPAEETTGSLDQAEGNNESEESPSTENESGERTTKFINAHFFIVEDQKVVMFEENVLVPKRHPYISSQAIQDTESILGLALLESVRPLLEIINSYAGKQKSLVEWCSNPTIFYGNKSGLAGRTTFSLPMGMQPVQDASDIKEFLANPNSLKVVSEYIDRVINMAREATGANEQFQGIDGSETATEFQGMQVAAGSRFADISDTLNQGLFEPLAQECYWYYRQFGVDGQMVVHPQTEEAAAVPITKADLQGEYRFSAVSAATENYKRAQIQDDTAFVGEMVTANQAGVFGMVDYNLAKHIQEISMPLRGQQSGKDMFIPKAMPMMPPNGVSMPMPGPGGPAPMPQEVS
jgi:hypothetical protein